MGSECFWLNLYWLRNGTIKDPLVCLCCLCCLLFSFSLAGFHEHGITYSSQSDLALFIQLLRLCCLPSCQLVSTDVIVLVPHSARENHSDPPKIWTFFSSVEIVLLIFMHPLSPSTWLDSKQCLKEAKQNLKSAQCHRAVGGAACIAAPGADPGSTCCIWQCRLFYSQGKRAAARVNQLPSVTRTPVRAVWLRECWTQIFLALGLHLIIVHPILLESSVWGWASNRSDADCFQSFVLD